MVPTSVATSVLERAVDKRAMAEILGVSVPTFDRMRRDARKKGKPIPETTYGRRLVRFHPTRVLRWVLDEQQRQDREADLGQSLLALYGWANDQKGE